jgi:hypothetical protein
MNKEPEKTFVLDGIFDSIHWNKKKEIWDNPEKVVEKNIIYILKQNKIWDKDFSIVFPCGCFAEIDVVNENYQYDYEIFKGFEKIADGTCYGIGNWHELDNEFEILDMTLEIMSLEKIKKITDKEKVNFT